jgi:hypothetical protein
VGSAAACFYSGASRIQANYLFRPSLQRRADQHSHLDILWAAALFQSPAAVVEKNEHPR